MAVSPALCSGARKAVELIGTEHTTRPRAAWLGLGKTIGKAVGLHAR